MEVKHEKRGLDNHCTYIQCIKHLDSRIYNNIRECRFLFGLAAGKKHTYDLSCTRTFLHIQYTCEIFFFKHKLYLLHWRKGGAIESIDPDNYKSSVFF